MAAGFPVWVSTLTPHCSAMQAKDSKESFSRSAPVQNAGGREKLDVGADIPYQPADCLYSHMIALGVGTCLGAAGYGYSQAPKR